MKSSDTKLAEVGCNALISPIQDMHAFSRHQQAFLHIRFGLGGDVRKPYNTTIQQQRRGFHWNQEIR